MAVGRLVVCALIRRRRLQWRPRDNVGIGSELLCNLIYVTQSQKWEVKLSATSRRQESGLAEPVVTWDST
jgi:hypothetical protein